MLSVETSKLVVRIWRSVTDNELDGNILLATPVTACTLVIVTTVEPTLTTLAYTLFGKVVSVYWTKFPGLMIVPGNWAFELVIVLIPPE